MLDSFGILKEGAVEIIEKSTLKCYIDFIIPAEFRFVKGEKYEY